MKYHVGHGNNYLLLMIAFILLLPNLNCISTSLDVVNEKQFNKVFSHKTSKHILGLVQKSVVDYGNHKDVIDRTVQQIEELKFELDYEIEQQQKKIQRAKRDLESYETLVQKKKYIQELSITQLNQQLYQNYKQPRDYQYEQILTQKRNLALLEEKLQAAQNVVKEQQEQYRTEMENIDYNFSQILDIFALIDELKDETEPNTLGFNQKKVQFIKKIDELVSSKFSSSLMFLRTEMTILVNQNFQDTKTVDKVRKDLHSLIDDLFSKRDSSQAIYKKNSIKANEELNYFYEKKREASRIVKQQNLVLNSYEQNIFMMEEDIEKNQAMLQDTIDKIEEKRSSIKEIIEYHENKIKEIQQEKEGIKDIESSMENDQFTTFLVNKLQNHKFRMLEENNW